MSIGILDYIFNRNVKPNLIKEIELIADDYNTTLMKQRAVDIAVGRVARSLAMVEWKTVEKNKLKKGDLYYHLNVHPNLNQNATEFWQEVVSNLFEYQEALIVITSDDQFIVADDFEVQKYVLHDNIYKKVQKDNFVFERAFYESKVIHLTYQNPKLKTLFRELDKSYGELFNRLVQVSMRTNQLRATAKITGNLLKDKDASEYLQNFVDTIFKSFRKNSIAVVPTQDGMEYEEHSKETNTRSQVDELNKVSDEYLNTVLEAVGIHPGLVHGEMVEITDHQNNYISNVIQPLVERIADEVNRKFYYKQEFLEGTRLKPSLIKLHYTNVFDIGAAAEKIVGSSILTPNEAREAAGYERIDDPSMDEFYQTKNIQKLKGGESE